MAVNAQVSTQELNTIIANAWDASPLVQNGLAGAYFYNQAIYAEQSFFLDFTANYIHVDVDYDALQTAVIQRIERDLQITDDLNDAIAYTQFYTDADLTYALKTNKMHEALSGAKDLIENDEAFTAIIQGHFPPGFEQAPSFPVIIGPEDGPFGNAQNTFLSTALIEVAVELMGPMATIHDLESYLGDWIDYSAITHITPVNEAVFEIDTKLLEPYLANYTFGFHDSQTPLGLAFIHSGYAFGGFREEGRYADGKLFGPEDCSSWIAKLTQCDIEFSTVDQLFTYRTLQEGNDDYVDPSWEKSAAAQSMLPLYSPVSVEDPFTDIKAGQIMVMRKFSDEDHSTNGGYSGHTALVLGVTQNEQVVTLNYTRNMPDIEGFGISLYDYKSDDVKEVVFLEPTKAPLCLEDVIEVPDSMLSFWGQTPLNIDCPFEEIPYYVPVDCYDYFPEVYFEYT